jgi:microcystin-dependent protein
LANLNFPVGTTDGQTYNNYTYVQSKNVWQSIPGLPAGVPAGTIMGWGGTTAPDQWVICDGSSVPKNTYSALFAAIGYTYGGSGDNFNLPDLRGRVPVGSQSAITLAGNPTITTATPAVVTLANHGLATGQLVYFTTTGVLPTGLTANTRYWVNVLTSSTFRLSTSLANALAGTSVATTVNGSGTHTVYSVDFELGRYNGEKTHKQTETELVSHTHSNSDGNASNYISAGGGDYGVQYSANLTGATGGGLPSNIMQPYGVINYIIKYAAAYVPQESELVPRINSLETGGTNYIINGGFDIWQRGTTAVTANSSYAADRWMIGSAAGTNSVTQSADVPTTLGMQYSISFAGTSTTNPTIRQRIEAQNALYLAGQTVTLSFYAKSTVGSAAIKVNTGYPTTTADTFGAGFPTAATTTADQTALAVTPTGNIASSWTRYSVTFTVSANAVRGYQIDIYRESTTTSTTTLITGVQLEPGSYATSFKRNGQNIQAEMAACQRYYITGSMGNTYYIGSGNGTGVGTHGFSFAPMRVAPTATVLVFTNSDNAVNSGISVFSNSAVNGNFRNSNTAFPYYNFTATFKLEAEL